MANETLTEVRVFLRGASLKPSTIRFHGHLLSLFNREELELIISIQLSCMKEANDRADRLKAAKAFGSLGRKPSFLDGFMGSL